VTDKTESLRRRRLAGNYPVPIFVRATEDEAEAIKAHAGRSGRSVSRYLAELGAREDGAPLPPRPSEAELAELSALRYELRKVGVNLNQLAHRENSADVGGPAEPPSEAELIDAARGVRAVVERLAERLA
jgi:hypothetical protein